MSLDCQHGVHAQASAWRRPVGGRKGDSSFTWWGRHFLQRMWGRAGLPATGWLCAGRTRPLWICHWRPSSIAHSKHCTDTAHRPQGRFPPSAHVHRQLPGISVSFAVYAGPLLGDCSALVPTPPSATLSMSCHSSVIGTQGCGRLCLTEHRATLL